MRDVIFTLVIFALVPVCYRKPFVGLLTFSWLAYMRPQDLTWGFARRQRWSFLIAFVTAVGWVINNRGRLIPNLARCHAMMVLIVLVGIGVGLCQEPNQYQINRYLEYTKVVGVALFTCGVVKDRHHLRLLVWVIALSFGFYGVKVGLAGVLSGGSLVVNQGPGGMLEDNNDFSLALCMALPMLVHIGTSERREIFRKAMRLVVPLTVLTVILTHSRGGFLSLMTVALVLAWRSRNRVAAFSFLAVLGAASVLMVPESYKERISTIGEYESDGSAMGRLRAWRTAVSMAVGNPVFGVGFNKFQQHYLEYSDVKVRANVRVAHNSYLQIWAECGTPAFLIYLFLIVASFWDLRRVRKMATERYHTSWIVTYATMFETSLCAFVVGGVFLNRAHFDLFYHFIAIIVVFGIIARKEMASTSSYPLIGATRLPIHVLEGRGFTKLTTGRGFRNTPLIGGAR